MHRTFRKAGPLTNVGGWVLGVGLLGCFAGSTSEVVAPSLARQARVTEIFHEECLLEKASTVDVNFDQRPDTFELIQAGNVVCRALDLNFDGQIDDWAYFDETGAVRRRETDFDRDGKIDEVAVYQQGVLVEKRRASTTAGRWDTWHFYLAGKMDHTERDSNGDGYVDQWWEYGANRTSICPLIHSDVDGDGRPDPGATIDLCEGENEDNVAGDEPERETGSPSLGEIPTEVNEVSGDSISTGGESE